MRKKGERAWLIDEIGDDFTLLHICDDVAALGPAVDVLAAGDIPVKAVVVAPKGSRAMSANGIVVVEDEEGLAAARFDATNGTTYLFGPDQHVCARWRTANVAKVKGALDRATMRA